MSFQTNVISLSASPMLKATSEKGIVAGKLRSSHGWDKATQNEHVEEESIDVAVMSIEYVAISGVPGFVLCKDSSPELTENLTIPSVLTVQRL